MNLFIGSVLHVVSQITLSGVPVHFTYIESGAPTVCAFSSLSWDGSAWHAQVGGCLSDRIFSSGFERN